MIASSLSQSPSESAIAQPHCIVRIHRTEQEINSLRPHWETLQSKPNSDIDHYLLVCRSRSEIISPYTLSIWTEATCCAIIAARLEVTALRPSIGYLRLPSLAVKQLSILYDGIIGEVGDEEAKAVLAAIENSGRNADIDVAAFSSLPENSPFWEKAPGSAVRIARWAEHWQVSLPREPGFLLTTMKSKHRSWAKRKAAEFETAFSQRFTWRWITDANHTGALCDRLEMVAAKTYQRGLGAGFKNDELHRRRLQLFSQQGRLRILLLEVDQQPRAFWYGIVYRGTFFSEATGYVEELRQYEIGTQLFLRLVDALIGENVGDFDFGLGDATYKRRFGTHHWRESDLRIYGRSLRARLAKTYIGAAGAIDASLRRAVTRLGVMDRIKTAWRKRLARSITAPGADAKDTDSKNQ